MSAEQVLKERGIVLPECPSPKGNYVPGLVHNGILYLSGQGPLMEDGEFATGLVGRDFTVDQAYHHARQTGLVLLSAARQVLGSLDKIERVLSVFGMVNAVPGFGDQPKVINGCSDLFVEVFGGSVGGNARQYTGEKRVSFRLFDIVDVPDAEERLQLTPECIALWREGGGRSFATVTQLRELAAKLAAALGEPREQLEHAVERPWARPSLRHFQIFEHGQVAEYLASFRHVAHAERGNAVRRPARRLASENLDLAHARRRQTHQAAHGGGLAGAIAAEHGDDLAFLHLERHAVKDVALAVEGVDLPRIEDDGHAAVPR